jgi:hypothetical protein
MMAWPTTTELTELVERFQLASLDQKAWTHAAHLVVGTWHVRHYGVAGAVERLRAGILRLNAAHGTPNTDTRGYHETITRAYVTLLDQFVAARADEDVAASARAVLASPLATPTVLLSFYSPERLMSVEARRGWVEPDLAPLPPRRGACT